MDQSFWEEYISLRDRLEALDRLPKSDRTDAEATRLHGLLRDIEDDHDIYELNCRYDDPDKAESKERQIQSYVRMYQNKVTPCQYP